MSRSPYLECGKIASTHGVRGCVRVVSLCDSPKVLAALKRVFLEENGLMKELKVLHASLQKNLVLMTFEEIRSLEEANLLRNHTLYALREDLPLPEGSFFLADLIGLSVIDEETGEIHGTVRDLPDPAGRRLYEVETPDGQVFYIPAVPEFIRSVRTEGPDAGIYVHLIDGMKS